MTISTQRYRYGRLWEVKSTNDFRKVYIDLVQLNYDSVLGRGNDDNENMINPMRNRSNRILCVLNDWDLATSNIGSVSACTVDRTGSGPFMAMDLLDNEYTGGHLYRHDLESLFYVLIWATAHYDLGTKNPRQDVNPAFEHWEIEYELARARKYIFITQVGERDKIYRAVLPIFVELRDRWLIPLWEMFSEAFAYASLKKVKLEDAITFEAFMNALGYKPRTEAQNQQPAA